jgi:L-threonylcarbamoyladenylate synthase
MLASFKIGVALYYTSTDTVWGIGCDARNEAAVERIYKLKKRSDNKSMIVLLENENQINKYVRPCACCSLGYY